MANVTTVARPYAKAILALAKQQKSFAVWSNMLQLLSCIVKDPLGYKVVSNLAIASKDKAQFMCDVAGEALDAQGKNLVKLLARGKRLLILPELYRLYDEMRKVAEGLVEVDLTLAQTVDQSELDNIQTICERNIIGHVELTEGIEADLICGGIAAIGNRVIDASVQGRLRAMHVLLKE